MIANLLDKSRQNLPGLEKSCVSYGDNLPARNERHGEKRTANIVYVFLPPLHKKKIKGPVGRREKEVNYFIECVLEQVFFFSVEKITGSNQSFFYTV